MDGQGTLVTHVYTSDAEIPLPGATVTVTQTLPDGTQSLLAVRLSNLDGFTAPIFIAAPLLSQSQQYQQSDRPYAVVDIRVEHTAYDRILVRGAQIFSDTETLQELMLVPTPGLPDAYSRTETFVIPPQTL